MKKDKKFKIAIVGLGYVGLPLALLSAKKGHTVYGIDLNQKKIDELKMGKSEIKAKIVTEELAKQKVSYYTDFDKLPEANIVVICVPTPIDEKYLPDLKPVINASKSVAEKMTKGQLIIVESTINPGVSEDVVIPLLEKESGLKINRDFYFAHCPERINPGDPKWHVENIPRVLGASGEKALQLARDFYESILTGPVKSMANLKEAEACKVVENSFRDVNIAFVNELAKSFSVLGIDVVNVIDGAATKPFAFMAHYPGCGVGGHCIPVDPYYLIEYARQNGFEHHFLSLAREVNNSMPAFTVETLIKALSKVKVPIKDAKVAVLGLSYKANINDCRESPSFKIIKELEKEGLAVVAYDPYVPDKSQVHSLEEALNDVHAIIIATGHAEFLNLTPEILNKYHIKVVIDGRNCLDGKVLESAGIVYQGIGR